MKLASAIIFVFLFAVAFGARCAIAADVPTHAPSNAALDYWQAIYFLSHWDPKDRELLDNAATMPLDAEAERLVARGKGELPYLRYGAQEQECDWGLHIDEGSETLVPYLNEVRDLKNIGILKARFDLRDKKWDAAVEQWGACLALSHHVGADHLWISLWVGYSMEESALNAAAADLNQLDMAALQRLTRDVDELPAAPSLASSLGFTLHAQEQWFIRAIHNDDQWEQTLVSKSDLQISIEAFHAAVKASGGTTDAVVAKIQALDSLFDQMEQMVSLPYDQFQQRWPELSQALQANPMYALFMKPHRIEDIRLEVATAQTRMELFKTAIAVLQTGPKVLDDHPDPYDSGKAFTYHAYPDGFELASKLKDKDGHPVTLRVGRDKPPQTQPSH